MLKKEKVEFYKELKSSLDGKDFIVFDYRGVNVSDLTGVRRDVRHLGGSLRVVKNTLLKRYAKEKGLSFENSLYHGMSAVVVVGGEFSATGKIVYDMQKDEKVKIKAGVYESLVVDGSYVAKLSSIPGRQELYSYLVGALQGVIGSLAYVLDAVYEQKNK